MKNKLYLDILPEGQMKLWEELSYTPNHFTLYGGTALALQLGHRESIDFDFFTNNKINTKELYNSINYLKGSVIEQESNNTLTCVVGRSLNSIQVSFFGDLELPKLNPVIKADNNINIASVEDILTTKLKTIVDRNSYKDYLDIATGLEHGVSLEKLINNTKKLYGKNYNVNLSLKALTYFDDITELNQNTKDIIVKHVQYFLKKKVNKEINLKDKSFYNLLEKTIWFQKPEVTKRNKNLFLNYLMQNGTFDDVTLALQYYSLEEFKDSLFNANVGIFSIISWSFWHYILGFVKVPRLPYRKCFTEEEANSINSWLNI